MRPYLEEELFQGLNDAIDGLARSRLAADEIGTLLGSDSLGLLLQAMQNSVWEIRHALYPPEPEEMDPPQKKPNHLRSV